MTYHDYPLTLEERLENAFLSLNKEEEVKSIIQEIKWDSFSTGWEARKACEPIIKSAFSK